MKNTLLFIMTIAVLVLCMPLSSCSCDISLSDVATLDLYGIDPYTLDPALSGDATSHQYITQIFSGLVKFDSGLQIVGDIAKDWEMSPDGFKYLFKLRPEAVFHDGRQVTAGDFKNSWERACNPLTGSQTAALYFGDILGATEVIKGEASEITGVRVIDNFTLEVTLKEPKNYFLYKIAYPAAYVVDTKQLAVRTVANLLTVQGPSSCGNGKEAAIWSWKNSTNIMARWLNWIGWFTIYGPAYPWIFTKPAVLMLPKLGGATSIKPQTKITGFGTSYVSCRCPV